MAWIGQQSDRGPVHPGFLYPWASIRITRYRASCITFIGSRIGDFAGAAVSSGSAVGEEVASFFDIDFGL